MKKYLLLFLLLFGGSCFEILRAQVPDTLFISTSRTVHLRFASELKYVNLGNRTIIARIVEGSKDFVAVKAREPFETVTSLSCLETNGAMHTFIVAYMETPPQLDIDTRFSSFPPFLNDGRNSFQQQAETAPLDFDKITAMKQELYHIGSSAYGIDILCENLFVKGDVLFLLISFHNGSAISYDISEPRFCIESKRRTKRGLQYEKAVFPKQSYGLGNVQPGGTGRLVFTFDKLALLRGQVLRVYWYEKGGTRNMVLTFQARDINKIKLL